MSKDRSITCLRCNTEMQSLGEASFHEKSGWDFLGTMFEQSLAFSLYACPNCRKVEFFLEDADL